MHNVQFRLFQNEQTNLIRYSLRIMWNFDFEIPANFVWWHWQPFRSLLLQFSYQTHIVHRTSTHTHTSEWIAYSQKVKYINHIIFGSCAHRARIDLQTFLLLLDGMRWQRYQMENDDDTLVCVLIWEFVELSKIIQCFYSEINRHLNQMNANMDRSRHKNISNNK